MMYHLFFLIKSLSSVEAKFRKNAYKANRNTREVSRSLGEFATAVTNELITRSHDHENVGQDFNAIRCSLSAVTTVIKAALV